MNLTMSDRDLLHLTARQLGIDAESLMRRYYGADGDVLDELQEFDRTGVLQPSFAELLRSELRRVALPAE